MRHRGPDADGVWIDDAAGVALGHRRLSIIDLSEEGAQPMASADGRYICVYNGEIFNFRELRGELEPRGHAFRGHSDTEVLLALCCELGVEKAIGRLVGMFAIGIWDRRQRELYLVRDRLGVKPLYWGCQAGSFFFASELDALRLLPRWSPRLRTGALEDYLRRGYVAGPASIFEDVSKLQPGHILRWRPGASPTVGSYWSLAEIAHGEPVAIGESDAIAAFGALASDAVRRRMISDVPLGAFLSGGTDSALVVAKMQEGSAAPVNTFTIGFTDSRLDESDRARRLARHLGTAHHEVMLGDADLLALVPEAVQLYDEPFADYSQIPTLMLCRTARKSVTVALSGDGGDELMAGYNTYRRTLAADRAMRRVPRRLRRGFAHALLRMNAAGATGHLDTLLRRDLAGERIERLGRICLADGAEPIFDVLSSLWQEPAAALADRSAAPRAADGWDPDVSPLRAMQLIDSRRYLPDDILTKVDRASMAVSLEVRTPLLDHRVVEFAWRLPDELKYRSGKTKWLLREDLARYLPAELVQGPKKGFTPPIGRWLRGPLRGWAEALLDAKRLKEEGLFDPGAVALRWGQHLAGTGNWERQLWAVLAFQSWQDKIRRASAAAPNGAERHALTAA